MRNICRRCRFQFLIYKDPTLKKKSQIIVRNISIDFSCYILSSSVDWKFTVDSFANFCCRQLIYCNLQLASLLLYLLREKSSGKQGPNPSLGLVLNSQSKSFACAFFKHMNGSILIPQKLAPCPAREKKKIGREKCEQWVEKSSGRKTCQEKDERKVKREINYNKLGSELAKLEQFLVIKGRRWWP